MYNVISSRVTMELLNPDTTTTALDVDLAYDALDPCAVQITYDTAHGPTTRVFSRDLLLAGLLKPCGQGDIHVGPQGACGVSLTLSAPQGPTVLHANIAAIAAFLLWTDTVVPFGDEPLADAIDDGLALLCETGTATAPARRAVSYHVRLEAGELQLTLAGDIDCSQGETLERAARAVDRPGALNVDMAQVAFMDSTGLNFLTRLRRRAQERDSAFAVSGLQDQPMRVALATRFPDIPV